LGKSSTLIGLTFFNKKTIDIILQTWYNPTMNRGDRQMSKTVRVTVTMEFDLNEELVDQDPTETNIMEYIRDSMEDERIGAANYKSTLITNIKIAP